MKKKPPRKHFLLVEITDTMGDLTGREVVRYVNDALEEEFDSAFPGNGWANLQVKEKSRVDAAKRKKK